MDMETSDEEEEDGQFTKYDEEEERDRKLFSKIAPEEDSPITLEDLKTCHLNRSQIAKYCMAPWFEEYVKGEPIHFAASCIRVNNMHAGAWVRYLIGNETNAPNSPPVYRICEVSGRSVQFTA